jgi:hypothetical protein
VIAQTLDNAFASRKHARLALESTIEHLDGTLAPNEITSAKACRAQVTTALCRLKEERHG